MRLIDLSQPLFAGCPNCPVHPPVRVDLVSTHERDGWQVEMLSLTCHSGSHVDAPLHKVAGGASISEIPLERFAGKAVIADLRSSKPRQEIDSALLKKLLPKELNDRIVLLATGWGDRRARSEEWFYQSPRLSPDGARWLVQNKIRGVGIDHYTVGGSDEPDNATVHEILLGGNVWILEELKFPPVAFDVKQPAMFFALPINLKGQSGSFCRPVIVIE